MKGTYQRSRICHRYPDYLALTRWRIVLPTPFPRATWPRGAPWTNDRPHTLYPERTLHHISPPGCELEQQMNPTETLHQGLTNVRLCASVDVMMDAVRQWPHHDPHSAVSTSNVTTGEKSSLPSSHVSHLALQFRHLSASCPYSSCIVSHFFRSCQNGLMRLNSRTQTQGPRFDRPLPPCHTLCFSFDLRNNQEMTRT